MPACGGISGWPGGNSLRTSGIRAFSASKCLDFFKGLGHKIGKESPLDLENHSQEGYHFFFASHAIKDRTQKSISGRVLHERQERLCQENAVKEKLDSEKTKDSEIRGHVACAGESGLDHGLIITKDFGKVEIVGGIKINFMLSTQLCSMHYFPLSCIFNNEGCSFLKLFRGQGNNIKRHHEFFKSHYFSVFS
ncbi:Uncharacterised protein [uncultured archaeon]|nr:Uncharacterised protein [uncultured archaeon]